MSPQRQIFIITCGVGESAHARRLGYSVASTASLAPNETPAGIK